VSIAKILPSTAKAFSELNMRRRLTPRTSAKASATGARTGGISDAGGLAGFLFRTGFAGFRLFPRPGLFESGNRVGLFAGFARPARFGLARFFEFTTSASPRA
jgi:hypothetical protein